MGDPLQHEQAVLDPRGAIPDLLADESVRLRSGGTSATLWGGPGEQDMAFILSHKRYATVIGPGGVAGKSASAKGLDAIFIHLDTGEILIPDNKAVGVPGSVKECSAFTENLLQNVRRSASEIATLAPFPRQQVVIARLRQLQAVLERGGGILPEGITFAITNAGGYATGLDPQLQQKFSTRNGLTDAAGRPTPIAFIDLVGEPTIEARRAQIARARSEALEPGRGVTKAVVVEPPAHLIRRPGLGRITADGWILILETFKATIVTVLDLVLDSTIERDVKAAWPGILDYVTERPDEGVLLVYTYDSPENFDGFGYLVTGVDNRKADLRYRFLNYYPGESANLAYEAHLRSPGVGVLPSHHRWTRVFQWFSATDSYRYQPPPLPD